MSVVTEPELFGAGGIGDLLRSVGDMTDNVVNLVLKDFAEELSKQEAFDEVSILILVFSILEFLYVCTLSGCVQHGGYVL